MNSVNLGRAMVLVAHPDDESGAAGILLQRALDPMVVFCTDGAPADPWFWKSYGSRDAYAEVRRREALEALEVIGVNNVSFLTSSIHGAFQDQLLHTVLPAAINIISRFVRWYAPDSILTTAYEGGHPDHDSCSFIASVVGRMSGVPVWEVPLYHRTPTYEIRYQRFATLEGTEICIEPSPREAAMKKSMLARYSSQHDLSLFTSATVEYVRPQKAYDYSRPPLPVVNYEQWRWSVSASDLCERFSSAMLLQQLPATHNDPSSPALLAGVQESY